MGLSSENARFICRRRHRFAGVVVWFQDGAASSCCQVVVVTLMVPRRKSKLWMFPGRWRYMSTQGSFVRRRKTFFFCANRSEQWNVAAELHPPPGHMHACTSTCNARNYNSVLVSESLQAIATRKLCGGVPDGPTRTIAKVDDANWFQTYCITIVLCK